MNKSDLEELVAIRLRDAEALLAAERFAGAYYLAGYAVECALKACIASKVRAHEFPNRQLANDSNSHDLLRLVGVAGLKRALETREKADREFAVNWAAAKDWSSTARYNRDIAPVKARELFDAVADPDSGILEWLKTHW